VQRLLDTAAREKINLDSAGLGYTLNKRLAVISSEFDRDSTSLDRLNEMVEAVSLARAIGFDVNLWKAQNSYYHVLQSTYPDMLRRNDDASRLWVSQFTELGQKLNVKVDSRAAELMPAAA
jgi:hypothetical protein